MSRGVGKGKTLSPFVGSCKESGPRRRITGGKRKGKTYVTHTNKVDNNCVDSTYDQIPRDRGVL